jgi:hypothetical protein
MKIFADISANFRPLGFRRLVASEAQTAVSTMDGMNANPPLVPMPPLVAVVPPDDGRNLLQSIPDE